MTMSIVGGCYCGAVRYEAKSAPLGSMVCHCQSCRRIAGAPVVAWFTVAQESLQLRGPTSAFESSAGVRRSFCTACGTPITYQNAKSPEEIDVTTCTLDDPNALPPTHHSWLSHDLRWVRFGDELPTYSESRYGSG